jgi:tetratricopeptide (TPR) repeat protein
MPINFRNIKLTSAPKRPVDPVELFHSLRRTEINDLWLAQGQALQEWHKHRALRDVAVMLNTGAGKTLVGLLAAQSLVNETSGPVVYACSSIYLVQQTANMAESYGLPVTTYFRGHFSNDLYHQRLAPCVTTYHALFNGKSRFFLDGVVGAVFDDAHTAEHLLRDQFTLTIEREKLPDLFNTLVSMFQRYHDRIGKGMAYRETFNLTNPQVLWFVPPFALYDQLGEVNRLLLEAELGERSDTTFVWEYLRDRLDLCALFISGQEIAFTPLVIPISTASYFAEGVRRLYLSATLAADDAFLRTFGRKLNLKIAPVTTAGESERLILVPRLNPACAGNDERGDTIEITVAKAILAAQKGLVLVPSYYRAQLWQDATTVQARGDVTELIEGFKRSKDKEGLTLVRRYDGVDLPGDACRVLVLDDLPTGVSYLERFQWETLGLSKSLRSTLASRVVQSFGRISRGMNDYGVVVLTGKRLVYWLLEPHNRSLLPEFLRKQLELGMQLSRQAATLPELVDAAQMCLRRDPGWLQFYEERENLELEITADNENQVNTNEALAIAEVEVEFGNAFWDKDFEGAARKLDSKINATFDASINIGAWHRLWLGYCYQRMGNLEEAEAQYRQAHGALKGIPPYVPQAQQTDDSDLPQQVREVASYLHGGLQVRRGVLDEFDRALAPLQGAASVPSTEESMRALGQMLGLDSSRPDKEFGTGPDVLWNVIGNPVLSMELKTGKIEANERSYWKHEVGQVYNHLQWVKDNTTSQPIFSVFVGPLLPAAHNANPSEEIMVIELEQFRLLAQRLRATLEDICAQATVANLSHVVLDLFRSRNLLWPGLYDDLEKHRLRDL